MVAVLVAALALYSLRQASQGLASLLFTAAVMALSAATLLGCSPGHPARLAWLGFAIFGWAHLAADFWPSQSNISAPRLMTTWLIDSLLAYLRPALFEGYGKSTINWSASHQPLEYHQTARSLLALLSASFGALMGSFCARDRRAQGITPDQRPKFESGE